MAVGDRGTIVQRSAAGWTVQASPTTADLIGVWGADATNVYAIAGDGTLLHYDGSTWMNEPLFGAASLTAISGTGPDDIFVVGNRAMFHRDANGWAPVRLPTAAESISWRAVAADASRVVMLGSGAQLKQLEQLVRD